MKNWKHWKFLALIAIFGIIINFIACDNGNETGDLCNCPNGTLHLVGETRCNGANCNCEKDIAGQRVNGIPITNRENVANFNAMVAEYEEQLDWLTPTQLAFVNANLKEVKIINVGVTFTPATISNNILIVPNDNLSGEIWTAVCYWCTANSID